MIDRERAASILLTALLFVGACFLALCLLGPLLGVVARGAPAPAPRHRPAAGEGWPRAYRCPSDCLGRDETVTLWEDGTLELWRAEFAAENLPPLRGRWRPREGGGIDYHAAAGAPGGARHHVYGGFAVATPSRLVWWPPDRDVYERVR